jgi:hypothetical protein
MTIMPEAAGFTLVRGAGEDEDIVQGADAEISVGAGIDVTLVVTPVGPVSAADDTPGPLVAELDMSPAAARWLAQNLLAAAEQAEQLREASRLARAASIVAVAQPSVESCGGATSEA